MLSNKIYFKVTIVNNNAVITLCDENGNTLSYDNASASGDTLTIKNEPGSPLPNTGGPGSAKYYVLGSMLIAGSMLYEYSLRRRERRLKK